jgi:hypothetical protein
MLDAGLPMFELPEHITLARRINEVVAGKIIRNRAPANSPHKFVWYNRTHEECAGLTADKTVGPARVRGRWLFIPRDPGYVLVFGQ